MVSAAPQIRFCAIWPPLYHIQMGMLQSTAAAATLFGTVNQVTTYAYSAVVGEVALLLTAIIMLRILPQESIQMTGSALFMGKDLVTISDEEILRIYGKRWDIEVFFKMCKSYLALSKEFQGRPAMI